MFRRIWTEQVDTEKLAAELTGANETDKADILILHGAGDSHRGRAAYLADLYAQNGLSALRFDFSGHGESSGEMLQASLNKRLSEARHMAKTYLRQDKPATVLGVSMGGHVASRLLPDFNIGHLVLFCPAAYPAASEDKQFGADFRAIISQSRYQDAPQWPDLKAYTGMATLIMGESDTIIPAEVIRLYVDALEQQSDFVHIGIPDAGHALYDYLPSHPDWLDTVEAALMR
jgi:pimeloyl-ACP methyl ester carboxylesterase